MAGQVSPGVVIKERDLTNARIDNTVDNVGALVAPFERGPVNEIVNIVNEKGLLETFGKPNKDNAEYWFTATNFLAYGGQLNLVRVGASTLVNAVSDGATATLIENDGEYVTNHFDDAQSWHYAAKTGGAYGNSVSVHVVDHGWDADVTLSAAVTAAAGATAYLSNGVTGKLYAAATAASAIKLLETNGTFAVGTDNLLIRESGGTSTTLDGAIAAGDAAITVTAATNIAVGDHLLLASGEIVKVTDIASAPQLSVDRAQFGTTAAAAADGGDVLELSQRSITASSKWWDMVKLSGTDINWNTLVGRPGTSTYAANFGSKYDELSVVVLDSTGKISGTKNTVLEKFQNLSKSAGAQTTEGADNYYVNVLRFASEYIYYGKHDVTNVDTNFGGYTTGIWGSEIENGRTYSMLGYQSYALAGGLDGYGVTAGDLTAGYDRFADTEDITLDYILAGPLLTSRVDSITVAQKCINIASSRKDCIAFVSPYKAAVIGTLATDTAAQRDNVIDFFDGVGSSTSYAVFDSGWKYIYDRFNDTYRYVPCNGDVAGLCVQTGADLDPWFSPAGFTRGNLRGVIKLAYTPAKSDRDKLYQARINPISTFPGRGTVLFGDKTALSTPSAFDRINVRRLFLTVERQVEALAKNVLFDLNDEITRSSFAGAVGGFLREVQARRGLTDYLVICDETNNTGDVIDRNEFVAEIYLKPSRSINFITITFVATRTGVSFDEIVGR
jgi:hypothetical protein